MTRIELRPRPGLDGSGARWIDREDFVVKTVERVKPSEPATYVLQLEEPIPEGTRAIVHFKLSLDDQHREAFADLSFSTLEAFRVLSFGCRGHRLPVTPEGTTYTGEQAIACGAHQRSLEIELSSEPSSFDAVVARNLIRFTPAVEDLETESRGRSIVVSGRFEPEKRYELSIHPTALTDRRGRSLDLRGASRMSFFFPRLPKYLRWQKSYGTVERYGPKTVPMEGRGFDRVDLRIHPIDPLDRTFWPFVARPVVVDESRRPPSPGEEPEEEIGPEHQPSVDSIRGHLAAFGSPPLSRIVELPIDRNSSAHTFGLDLTPHLRFLSGENAAGHYLVGVRRLDGSNERHWMRLEVTDLSLSVVEEPHEVRFFVTSLKSGRPVANAKLRIEGTYSARFVATRWETFFEGTTDSAGALRWTPPGMRPDELRRIRRVVVEKDGDVLLIDPDRPPERFQDDRWVHGRSQGWLAWTVSERIPSRGEQAKTLCHLFTERPVYRPEEAVHLAGYARTRFEGALSKATGSFQLHIDGSGDLHWSVPLELSESGAFHHVFREEQLPTGVYRASVRRDNAVVCDVTFRMEAYRIPSFEVRLLGADEVPIDRAFSVKLSASYYAGGPVAARPVRWRVTQFPYTWSPPRPLEGFVYSTDSRWSRIGAFQSTPASSREATTDERGGATLELNPAIEPTAQPRTYVVEATIAGADDQTVTGTKQVHAIPPFVLGLKVPRFLEKTEQIRPEAVLVDPNGKPIAGHELVVRLIHRTWHSHLMASDFSEGAAKYITDVVEEKLLEKKVTSAKDPIRVSLPIGEGGVYVVEVEARDRLGRAQVIAVDLFAAGDQPITWKKPEDKVFEIAADKDSYDPGETAKLVLKSPFLSARALAIVEGPDRTEYHWLDVKNGVATFSHRVKKNEVPRLPVHFILMRGRLPGADPRKLGDADLGKPATMAATKWIAVNAIEHRVEVALEHPEKAKPGERVKMKIRLSDPKKKPLSGEVMLWLVDQAVLALGPEQKLDPLDAFITPAHTYLTVADTRNGVFGRLPLVENPGGDAEPEANSEAEGLLDKTTVRKNFESVPVFLSAVKVGPSGETTVTIALPDNLTNFKVRAKAVSGLDRFGYAKSTISVRLPVIVQPAMPRFVRAGDRAIAGGIARVVEGKAERAAPRSR